MKNQVKKMLELQNAMNSKVHADWRSQNYTWYRAIWIECAELMDHYGWKWWKQQQPDIGQVQLELVDIWHFGLSDLLQKGLEEDEIADAAVLALSGDIASVDLHGAVEHFTESTLVNKAFDLNAFVPVMAAVDLSFDQLYRQYIGKNVLNFFRQDNGYKDGSYIKVWEGKEDNEHLLEVIQSLDANAEDFQEAVYAGLQASYPQSA